MKSPLVFQTQLNYTENPVDIPNPDRGIYRGRGSYMDTIYGSTPEVDYRVPVTAQDTLYHGALPHTDDDDRTLTEFGNSDYEGTAPVPQVTAMPAIAFLGFDLCRFCSNAFLIRYADHENSNPPMSWIQNPANCGTSQPLTQFALDYIRHRLQLVRDSGGVAFVKFSYDGNGFNYHEGTPPMRTLWPPEPVKVLDIDYDGLTPIFKWEWDMCKVPGHTDKNWIQYHLWQLKPVFEEYEETIMCVKMGMFGPWGEQHTSPPARDPASWKMLFDAYLDAVPASRNLLTHAGAFLAWYNLTYNTAYDFSNIDTMPVPAPLSPEARFGFFNDSYAAGNYRDEVLWDDFGSLSEGARMFWPPEWKNKGMTAIEPWSGKDKDWDDRDLLDIYDREKLTVWISKQNTMYQGEGGIKDNVYGTFPGVVIEAFQMHVSNLNMRHGSYIRWYNFKYNEANITRPVRFPARGDGCEASTFTGREKTAFFDPVYEGKTGLEFFRDRMGYRLVLREASASEWLTKDSVLEFTGKIQNVGFGNVINKKAVHVLLKNVSTGKAYSALTSLDARTWLSSGDGNNRPDNYAAYRTIDFTVPMSDFGEVPPGNYAMYLKINDPKEKSVNSRCIRFANNGDGWDAELGANLIASTSVT